MSRKNETVDPNRVFNAWASWDPNRGGNVQPLYGAPVSPSYTYGGGFGGGVLMDGTMDDIIKLVMARPKDAKDLGYSICFIECPEKMAFITEAYKTHEPVHGEEYWSIHVRLYEWTQDKFEEKIVMVKDQEDFDKYFITNGEFYRYGSSFIPTVIRHQNMSLTYEAPANALAGEYVWKFVITHPVKDDEEYIVRLTCQDILICEREPDKFMKKLHAVIKYHYGCMNRGKVE